MTTKIQRLGDEIVRLTSSEAGQLRDYIGQVSGIKPDEELARLRGEVQQYQADFRRLSAELEELRQLARAQRQGA